MTTVQQHLAEQEAAFWQQKADNARHQAAFVSQSWHSHGPPVNINQQVRNPVSQISQIARANVAPATAGVTMTQQTVSSHDPALLQAKAAVSRQQAQATARLQAEVLAAINDTRRSIASINKAVNNAVNQARIQRGQAQVPPNYRPATSPYTKRPSRNRQIVNRSMGLPTQEPTPRPEQLPVSPYTGKPSKLRAMIDKSVVPR